MILWKFQTEEVIPYQEYFKNEMISKVLQRFITSHLLHGGILMAGVPFLHFLPLNQMGIGELLPYPCIIPINQTVSDMVHNLAWTACIWFLLGQSIQFKMIEEKFQKQSSEAVTCSSLNPSMLEEQKNGNTKAHCLNAESKAVNAFQAISDRIGEAVSDAFRAQLASEAVEQATGNPIAEFERLLRHSSPDISNPFHYVCHTCSKDQVGDVSLCRHEIPNVSLGCLWQWYEKHGNYGLEIRAEDYENTKRLGADRFSFRAYFVPYLSAVQLFRNCDRSVDTDNVVSSPGTFEKASNVCHLPILPILFPQPRKDLESFAPCLNQVGSPEPSSSSAHDVAPLQSAKLALSSDSELLLEYFETDQPQQRRPLYEKIKELVRGDGPSQHKVYGDHTILDSIKLNDLHPRSWYAVAWYPIYRIPEGNLRAAFLTFHSLGHLIRGTGSAIFDSEVGKNCLVAPVVGLQSYNAQGECWFQLRRSATKLNPAGILKERLRTLDVTASLMARAVVDKANISSVNWHSDSEFFSSRQRR